MDLIENAVVLTFSYVGIVTRFGRGEQMDFPFNYGYIVLCEEIPQFVSMIACEQCTVWKRLTPRDLTQESLKFI